MRKMLFVAAGLAALSACGSREKTQAEPISSSDTPVKTAADDVSGEYEVISADGSIARQRINANGTYVESDANGAETETGTWKQQGKQMCFDPAGPDPVSCYPGGAPSDDGSFRLQNADGSVISTVRKEIDQSGSEAAPSD